MTQPIDSENTEKQPDKSQDNALAEHPLVRRVLNGVNQAGHVMCLVGYIGKSMSDDMIRLYLNLDFDEYVDIPRNGIIHATSAPSQVLKFEGTYLWVSRDVDIVHTRVDFTKQQADFLKGNVSERFGPKSNIYSGNRNVQNRNIPVNEMRGTTTFREWPCYTLAFSCEGQCA